MLKQLLLPIAVLPLVLSASIAQPTQNTQMAAATSTTTNNTLTPAQTSAVKNIVGEYLKDNPKVVIDAIMAYRQQEIQKFQAEATQAISANKEAIFNTNNELVLGNPKGDITIVEFLDYRCGHCKAMGPILKQAIKQDPNLKVIVKELPIFGGPSTVAAKAAIAAQKQKRFAKVHEFLLTTKNTLTKDNIVKAARKMGLNARRFKKDLASKATTNYVETNMNLAKTLKISATPTFIISKNNGETNQYIPGAMSLEQLQAIVNAMRNNQTTTAQ